MEENKKKESKRSSLKKIGKYFREVSVVVIGVAITFIVSDWISARNEKKDLQRYLNAIKLELEENHVIIQDEIERYGLSAKFSQYLNSTKRENLQADSLIKYRAVIGDLYAAAHNTSAFEMLKSSGAMRLIKDDILLVSIISCYTSLEEARNARDSYIQRKMDELFDAVLNKGFDINNINNMKISDLKSAQILNFYAIEIDVAGSFKDCARQIEKTLILLQ